MCQSDPVSYREIYSAGVSCLSDARKSIVVIGGGSGSSAALRGLKAHNADLSAIVTMFDSGGSTGILREEFGYPPLGDIRQCIVALSPEQDEQVAALMVQGFGGVITRLTEDQASYIGVSVDGPFKTDSYKY